ncbi:MAG: SulP family inorganic anion transporter [Fuerstiella sp.]|nr:SulP family inorganic anion transporter [Fuerstiella sp.]
MSTTTSSANPATSPESQSTFKTDFMASLVVFLVALPLCIGIAVAVGVNPARALITGIIGGLIVGLFSGSPLQVSGPAAGLFVIIADLLANSRTAFEETSSLTGTELENAQIEYSLIVLGASVFLAGVLQVVAGQLRLGQWFRAVSPAVIKGMLAGIGILILVSQFHVMLDHVAMWDGAKARGAFQLIATAPEAVLKCFSSDTSQNHHLAAVTGIVAIACFVGWPLVAPKPLKFLPAALIGILVATVVATATNLEVQKLEVPDNMFSEVTLPSIAWGTLFTNQMVLTGAFVIALVASAETLLCATAVDQMHQGPRTKYDQELTAQGVGNVLCGIVGALPMTGVIVRSSANVTSGAKTRWSTVMHGLWLLIFVAAIPFVLTYIPRSALGALLVYTGFKLVKIDDIKSLWKTSRSEAWIYFATVGTIVATDLLKGVILGIVLSALKLLLRFSNIQVDVRPSEEDEQTTEMHIQGAATFVCLPKLAASLEKVPTGSNLRVYFDNLTYIDHACLDLLMNWARQHANFGGELIIDWDELAGRFTSEAPKEVAPNSDE